MLSILLLSTVFKIVQYYASMDLKLTKFQLIITSLFHNNYVHPFYVYLLSYLTSSNTLISCTHAWSPIYVLCEEHSRYGSPLWVYKLFIALETSMVVQAGFNIILKACPVTVYKQFTTVYNSCTSGTIDYLQSYMYLHLGKQLYNLRWYRYSCTAALALL